MSNPKPKATVSATPTKYTKGPNLAKKMADNANGELPTFKAQASSVIKGVEARRKDTKHRTSSSSHRKRRSHASTQSDSAQSNFTNSEVTKKRDNRSPSNTREPKPAPPSATGEPNKQRAAPPPPPQLQNDESTYEFTAPKDERCCIIL